MANKTLGRGRTVPTHRLVPTWVLWVALALVVGGVLVYAGYRWPNISGFEGKKVWHWLGLAGVSLAIALVGWIVTRRQRERDEVVALETTQDDALRAYLDQMSNLMIDQKLGQGREDMNKGDALKGIVKTRKGVAVLLGSAEEELEDSSVRAVARARTIAILLGLDAEHKRRPLKLVYELGLIDRKHNILELKNAGLDHANLSELTLRDAYLKCADLRASDLSGADLSGIDLSLGDLRGADLRRADLKGADLTEANLLPHDERDPERLSLHNLTRGDRIIDLSKEKLRPRRLTLLPRRLVITRRDHGWPIVTQLTITNLQQADLTGARFLKAYMGGANLSGADLSDADLRKAELKGAKLNKTNLKGADLRGTKNLTQEQLEVAVGNHKTRLPGHLRSPKSWSKNGSTEKKGEPRR